MNKPILHARGLAKVVESDDLLEKKLRRTLWDVPELTLEKPEFVCLAGRNGAGKSTLLRTLLGLVKPTRGEVEWYGARTLAKEVVGYLPEHPLIPPSLKARHFLAFLLGEDPDKALERASNPLLAYPHLSVKSFLDVPAHRLSKGQQQRVLLWAALAHSPRGLVLDEPFSGLDPWARVELAELLVSLRKDQGLFLIVSTHELTRALRDTCDRTWLVEDGSVRVAMGCALPE